MRVASLAVLVVIASSCATVPVREGAALTSAEPAALEAFVQARLKAGDGVGLSVSVVKAGKVVLAKGFGVRARAPDVLVDAQTQFAIGSVSKQFTVACVLLLAEDGKLSVTDPVSKYFPSLTRAADITLLDLMHHVSGYHDYYPLDYLDRRMLEALPSDEVIARYAGAPLDFEPGTKFSYSNTGYLILGRIVELVSGESLGAFAQRRIFTPLGMTHTAVFAEGSPKGGDAAQGFTRFALGPFEPAIAEGGGWLGGAAAIWSTATDLARWNLALLGGEVLKPESLKGMTTPVRLINGATLGYAGGIVGAPSNGYPLWQHSGAVSGFGAQSMVDSEGTSVVVLSNCEDFDTSGLGHQLFEAVRPPPQVPVVKGAAVVDVARALVAQLQAGAVDRGLFTEEFAQYLDTARLREAKAALSPWGLPSEVKLLGSHERGGLEVAKVELTYAEGTLQMILYRRADGTIEEISLTRVVR